MLAAVFKGNGILSVEEREKPKIAHNNEVLIKIIAAGICGSDIHVLHVPPSQYGKPDTVMGHEFYGEIEEVGDGVKGYSCGDLVAVDPILKCGACDYCRNGIQNMCENYEIYGQTLDGGFAQYCVVSSELLYKIPKNIPSVVAAQTEPLACVMNGIKKIKPNPLNRILLYGAGPIGLTFLRVLKMYGVRQIIVVEMSAERREFAKKCGADIVMDPGQIDKKTILDIWSDLPDLVIDAVGAGAVLENALELLKCRGRFLIFGQNANAVAKVRPADICRNELRIIGSYITDYTFSSAIDCISDERLEIERLVSHKIELENILEGIELIKNKEAARVIVFPNGIVE